MQDKRMPLVSVIIPNYNYARYLDERIESVLNQTFTDFELILLDDVSTDNSLKVFDQYKDNPHVSCLVVNETNSGSPFKQWMKGILLAQGKYIWIAEADDLAESDFLEKTVGLAERHEDFAFCYAGSLLIDSDGGIMRNRDVNKWGRRARKEAAYFDGRQFAARNLYWKNYVINASGVLFRRQYALNLAESDFIRMRCCGDWLFWFQMALQGGVGMIYRNLNYFRQHTAKVTVASTRSGESIREGLQVVQKMEKELPLLKEYKKRLCRGRFYRRIKRSSLSEECKEELFDELSAVLGGTVADYRLERLNQFLRVLNPFILTPGRDRL